MRLTVSFVCLMSLCCGDYGFDGLRLTVSFECLMSWCCGDDGLRWVARETQDFASLLAGAVVVIA